MSSGFRLSIFTFGLLFLRNPLFGEAYQDSIIHKGLTRRFLVHIPKNLNPNKPVPLVIVLHGGGGTAHTVAALTGFSLLADSAKFVVVYPEGVNRHWNDGRDVQQFRAHREKIDDPDFISALIDTLTHRLKIDSARIYACGISNGGMMCHRLGIKLAHRLTAIATVAASLPQNLADSFNPSAPLPVLMINGTDDPVVPYEGGPVGIYAQQGTVLGVEQTAELWAEFNRCLRPPKVTIVAGSNEKPEIIRKIYPGGKNRSRVILYKIIGGGHVWPGGKRRPHRFGRQVKNFNATAIIWNFFQDHHRPNSAGAQN